MLEDIPPVQLHEMLRAASGVVTALVADDNEAARLQLLAIVREQQELSGGDPEMFLFRMMKQVEASAHVTHGAIKALAKRAQMKPDEIQQALAEAWTSVGMDK